jgi:hypothetical protein
LRHRTPDRTSLMRCKRPECVNTQRTCIYLPARSHFVMPNPFSTIAVEMALKGHRSHWCQYTAQNCRRVQASRALPRAGGQSIDVVSPIATETALASR